MAYSPQGEQGLTRAQVRPSSFTGDAKADKGFAKNCGIRYLDINNLKE